MNDLHTDEPATRMQPPEVDGYDVLQMLGAGGAGAVWVVVGDDGVRFAAKVVDGGPDELDHEASLLASIRHEHVVRLIEVQTARIGDRTGSALITELAEGGSLAQALALRDRLTPGELVTVLCPVARALHDLHGMGLVHADLSPGNILFTADGKPLIADLGVSRLAGVEGEDAWVTESWAAPEVLAGKAPSAAADTYSLGAIAWAAVAGAPPGPAAMRTDLVELAPEIPAALRDLIESCLEHEPDDRPSAGDLALALWDCAAPAPAPVAGSAGTRRAHLDAAAELTRRIRADALGDALDDDDADDVPWWKLEIVRRVAAIGAVLGTVCGLAVAFGPTAIAWAHSAGAGHHRQAAASPSPSPIAAGTAATGGRDRRPIGHAPATTAGGRTRATGLPSAPTKLVQRLVAARALAWCTPQHHRLDAAMQPASAAYVSDRRSLDEAAEQHVQYRDLKFVVRSASRRTPAHDGHAATVRATIDRTAYSVLRNGHRSRVAAQSGTVVDLQLRQGADGWRITDWRPVTPATASSDAG